MRRLKGRSAVVSILAMCVALCMVVTAAFAVVVVSRNTSHIHDQVEADACATCVAVRCAMDTLKALAALALALMCTLQCLLADISQVLSKLPRFAIPSPVTLCVRLNN